MKILDTNLWVLGTLRTHDRAVEEVDEGETVGNGALTTVRWYDGDPVGDGSLRGRFQGMKSVVGNMIDRGVFSESIARRYMMEKLAEWVGDRQNLVIPRTESASASSRS